MTKLIYPNPIEVDGKVIVSTEILTHYRCSQCNLFSTASDLETNIVYCHKCGEQIKLPPTNVHLVDKNPATQDDIDRAYMLIRSGLPKDLVKTNAISPDAGMPNRGLK